MTNYVCITHDLVMFMESNGKVIPRCGKCGLKKT